MFFVYSYIYKFYIFNTFCIVHIFIHFIYLPSPQYTTVLFNNVLNSIISVYNIFSVYFSIHSMATLRSRTSSIANWNLTFCIPLMFCRFKLVSTGLMQDRSTTSHTFISSSILLHAIHNQDDRSDRITFQ